MHPFKMLPIYVYGERSTLDQLSIGPISLCGKRGVVNGQNRCCMSMGKYGHCCGWQLCQKKLSVWRDDISEHIMVLNGIDIYFNAYVVCVGVEEDG